MKFFRPILFLLLLGVGWSPHSFGEQVVGTYHNEPTKEFVYPSEFKLRYNDMTPRGTLLSPLISVFLPGFDQIIESQYEYGVGYASVAVGGYFMLSHYQDRLLLRGTNGEVDFDALDNEARLALLGGLLAQGAGGLSGYHAFRTAAISHQRLTGNYLFLKKHDSIADIYAAPFRFEFLKRATTYIPLLIGVGINALIYNELKDNAKYETRSLTAADYFFVGAYSFNAGTHEEAVFRGWLFPMFHNWGLNLHLANILQAGLFAALHLSEDNRLPLFQFAGGLLDGYVTAADGWSIQEAVFGHVWWDVLAFTTMYLTTEKMIANHPEKVRQMFGEKPVEFWLPVLNLSF